MLLAIAALTSSLVIGETAAASGKTAAWAAVSRAWDVYRADPSQRNAERLYRLLPAKPRQFGGYGRPDLMEKLYGSLDWLTPRIMQGDRWAARIAFRFCALADAAFAADLHSMLGCMIRPQPLLFLEELSANRGSVRELSDVVLSFGIDEYANAKAPDQEYKAELQARLNTLRGLSFSRQNLKHLRDECTHLLAEEIAHGSSTR